MRSRLVVVLPGGGYGPQGAALRFPVLALKQLGPADSRLISYPAVAPRTVDGTASLIDAVAEQVLPMMHECPADEVVFVAKSVGTRALAGISDRLPRNRSAGAIWLTPVFGVPEVRDCAAASGLRSLIVAGDADPYHDLDGFEHVARSLGASTLLIEKADHALEVPGDVRASIRGLTALVTAVLEFAG
jgi:pimeloyl-ACP methyl ester carboxylesterase